MSTSILERSSQDVAGSGTAPVGTARTGTDGIDGTATVSAPRGYLRATVGLFALWALVVAFGIVMQSGPALSFG